MNDGDVILMKMLVHYTTVIYCYKTKDAVKTFVKIHVGIKFSAV